MLGEYCGGKVNTQSITGPSCELQVRFHRCGTEPYHQIERKQKAMGFKGIVHVWDYKVALESLKLGRGRQL